MAHDQVASLHLTATTTGYVDVEKNWKQISIFALQEILRNEGY
jgi:hypothetical protein